MESEKLMVDNAVAVGGVSVWACCGLGGLCLGPRAHACELHVLPPDKSCHLGICRFGHLLSSLGPQQSGGLWLGSQSVSSLLWRRK